MKLLCIVWRTARQLRLPSWMAALVGGGLCAAAGADPSMPSNAVGERIYGETCFVCHGQEGSGAPRLGVAEDWKKFLAEGRASLDRNAIAGRIGEKGVMPPKGGREDLTDEQIKAAVGFMLESLQLEQSLKERPAQKHSAQQHPAKEQISNSRK